jgi:hypothetical protein
MNETERRRFHYARPDASLRWAQVVRVDGNEETIVFHFLTSPIAATGIAQSLNFEQDKRQRR